MKKSITRKLALRQETLRALDTLRLTEIRGGEEAVEVGTRDPAGGCPFAAVVVGTRDPAGGCP
jgi:hypothetical protein